MCGIAGIYNFASGAPVNGGMLRHMTNVMQHRGPDGDGHYVTDSVGLGHRRLSILDLSERGRNPMFTSDGRYAITYNGEVYNYLELRAILEGLGIRFRTDTDTEVILQAYATYGVDCLTHFNGMFAFAIWDSYARTLFCARDRVGIKPLYYALTRDGLVFASEAKALLLHPDVPRSSDPTVLPAFLAFGYTPMRRTLFSTIQKLPPGHAMLVSAAGVREWQYWDADGALDRHRSADTTARELRALLEDAAAIHMRSDVPVGILLSGGLDSTALVSILSSLGFSNLHTFSVGYRHGRAFDETKYADIVARRFKTMHRTLYVDPRDFGDFIPQFAWQMDEPVAEGAALSLYFISKLLRQHVGVAISGEGADELFGGYDIYRYMRWLDTYRTSPAWLRHMLSPLLQMVPSQKVRKYASLADAPLERRYLGVPQYSPIPEQAIATTYRASMREFDPSALLAPLYSHVQDRDALAQMLYVDFKTWLPDDLLVKADRMTMANSVELRVPFLDYRVVEFAASIPSTLKQRGSDVKWILKRAMADLLPKEVLCRPKMGFPTPLSLMLRSELAPYVRETLLSDRARTRGFLDVDGLKGLIEEHGRQSADHTSILWRLVLVEEWHKQFIDGDGAYFYNSTSDTGDALDACPPTA